ncbi:18408_t:CDS:1, partial [Rhizophagus irregularis]
AENAELKALRQRATELEAELKAKKDEFEAKKVEFLKSTKKYYTEFEGYIVKLKHLSSQNPDNLESIEALIRDIKAQNVRNKSIIEEYEKELESKKNHKFQTRCIQIAKEILNEEPIIEYRPPFLNGLELDAFFQKYRIALEVQGAQHRLYSTSWYKDVKKLEDIVNRDRQKRCICLDSGIFLIEIWYDQNPEIVIPERIRKIKEFVYLASKSFDIL